MSWAEASYTIDEVGKVLSSKTDSGIPPTNLEKLTFEGIYDENDWIQVSPISIPKDTIVNKVRLCRVAGVAIILKENEYPIDEGDGERVADILVDGTIKIYNNRVGIEKDEVSNKYTFKFTPKHPDGYDKVWWIGCYAYSDHNVYNRNYKNVGYVKFGYNQDRIPDPILPGAYEESTVEQKWAFDQNFLDLNPETSITYPEGFLNSNFEPPAAGSNAMFYDLGDWQDFVDNVLHNDPYALPVNATGVAIAKLDRTNYELMEDGSSARNYSSFFSWLSTIWMKEEYAEDGNSRRVIFSAEPEEGFGCPGFINKNREQLEGVWLPMYWTIPNNYTNNFFSTQRIYMKTNWSYLISQGKQVYGTIFGGPIMNVLRDLMWLICRSTNIPNHINGRYAFFTNRVLNHEGFVNYTISEFPFASSLATGGVNFYDSDDYGGRTIALAGVCQRTYPETLVYCSKLKYMGPTFGSYPIPDNAGSASTGICYAFRRVNYPKVWNGSTNDSYSAYVGAVCNMIPPTMSLESQRNNHWNLRVDTASVASMVIPAVGYKPYS